MIYYCYSVLTKVVVSLKLQTEEFSQQYADELHSVISEVEN